MKKKLWMGLGVLVLVLGLNWGYSLISSPDLLDEDVDEIALDADLMEETPVEESSEEGVPNSFSMKAPKSPEEKTPSVVGEKVKEDLKEVVESPGLVKEVTGWVSSKLGLSEEAVDDELDLTKADLKKIEKTVEKKLDKTDMQYTPKMKVNVGVTPSVKCEGSFELKNVKSSLGQLGGLGVIASWSICTAHADGEVELKKNRASVTAVAMKVLIENFPKITEREKLEFTFWHKLNRVHPTALVSGVSLVALELEPLK